MEKQFVPLTGRDRAGKNGKSIYCGNCKEELMIGHLSWSALKCPSCKGYYDKHEWLKCKTKTPQSVK